MKKQKKFVNFLYFEARFKMEIDNLNHPDFFKPFEKLRYSYQNIKESNEEIKLLKDQLKELEVQISITKIKEDKDILQQNFNDLETLIETKVKKSERKLVYSYAGEASRLSSITLDDSGYFHLLFERLYTKELPIVTELNGESEAIKVEKNEYVGHQANVLYDSENSIFMVQRNRDSLGPQAIEEILREIYGSYYEIEEDELASFCLGLIMDETAHKRALKKNIFKKFHVELVQESKNEFLSNLFNNLSPEEIESIEITLKGKKGKNDSIPKEQARLLIRDFANNEDTLKLDIRGKDDEDSLVEPVDLLNQKLTTRLNFLLDATRYLNPISVFEEMMGAYDEKKGPKEVILRRRVSTLDE